jgi:hypothetical protein
VTTEARPLPPCEACRREPATSLSWFPDRRRWYAPQSGTWQFTCACTSAVEGYYLLLTGPRGFLASSEVRERWWLHLCEKRWFSSRDFAAMLARFVAAGGPDVRRPKGALATRYRGNVKPRAGGRG